MDSMKSFSFHTEESPVNVPARRFALKAEGKIRAIGCDCKWGPCFGADIGV
jgi:hypothetical protein